MSFRVSIVRSVIAVAAVAGAPLAASAQGAFIAQCESQSPNAQVQTFCERVGQAVEITQPRLGISLTGGNPVPGSASTLGMRLGMIPRISIGVRATASYTELPPIESIDSDEDLKFPLGSINADASIGVFNGLSVLPTVGGLGSIDVLGSLGMIPLPDGEGFSDESPMTWAVGARVGILRESFTAPGISVSAMYRKLDDISYGDSTFNSHDAYFAVNDLKVMSYRAAISKRIPLIGLGAALGVGYDKYDASARVSVNDPTLLGGGSFTVGTDELETSRKSAFANLSWTILVLNIVGEAGWQEGGDAPAGGTIPADKLEKAGYFGSVAVRLAF
jgi:hypothetical protein